MAKRTVVNYFDDLNGEEGARTVAFSIDGRSYEIDLTDHNLERLHEVLRPYVEAGRSTTRRKGKVRGDGLDTAAVREWATRAGIKVSSRGRIPSHVVEAYNAAN